MVVFIKLGFTYFLSLAVAYLFWKTMGSENPTHFVLLVLVALVLAATL